MFKDLSLLFPPVISILWAITLACRWRNNLRLQNICAALLALLGLIAFAAIYLLIEVADEKLIDRLSVLQTVLLTLPLTIIIYLFGYLIVRMELPETPEPIDPIQSIQPEKETIKNTDTPYRSPEKLQSEFNWLMNTKKIYLQKNLCREDVARLLNTNRTYISSLVREQYQCGFSEYINSKRIEYAQLLMRQNPELNQEQLAAQTGFTHPSAFSRTFKQYTGMTYRQYQKEIIG